MGKICKENLTASYHPMTDNVDYNINEYKRDLEYLKKKYEEELIEINKHLDDFENNKRIYFIDSSAYNFHRGYVDAKGNKYKLYEEKDKFYLVDNKTNKMYEIIDYENVSRFCTDTLSSVNEVTFPKLSVEVKKTDLIYQEPKKVENNELNNLFGTSIFNEYNI